MTWNLFMNEVLNKKKFWNINWKCVSFGGITLNKGKKKIISKKVKKQL